MSDLLTKSFSRWKIILAITLGLSISSWVLYNSLSQPCFVESSIGTHQWVDSNKNGVVDYSDESEFIASEHGNYIESSSFDGLSRVVWSNRTLLWIGLALLFMIGRDFFYMVRIRLLTNNQLNWRAAFNVIMIWEFASAVSPGVVGGAAVAMFILNRETIPFGKATAIVIITAFMDNLFYVVMIPLVMLILQTEHLFPENAALFLGWWFWIGFGVILSVCTMLYVSIFWYPKLTTRILLTVFSLPFLKRWRFIALEWGKDVERASKEFQEEKPFFWLKVFGSTVGSWISRYLVINCILAAFTVMGTTEHFMALGRQFILWLFMLVSPTPGGSGVAEYAFSELFASFSASSIVIAVSVLLWRLISYFPYLFIGVVLLPAWIRKTKS